MIFGDPEKGYEGLVWKWREWLRSRILGWEGRMVDCIVPRLEIVGGRGAI